MTNISISFTSFSFNYTKVLSKRQAVYNKNIPVVLVNFNTLKNISKSLQNVAVLGLKEYCTIIICFQTYFLALE